jgi:hypothetical protein
MQPAIRSFWESYVRRRGFDRVSSREKLRLATRYGAARLLQTAFEQSQNVSHLTGNLVLLLQLSLNMLARPDEAGADLLGIGHRA